MKVALHFLTIALVSLPLMAAKTFKDTSDYRDAKELKGYLNVKFDTYAQMNKEPKGTECDWVMVDPTFNLDELRTAPVTFFPDSISRNGGWDAGYWGMYGGWYSNGLVTNFESALRTRGINLQRPANTGGTAESAPMTPYQMAMAQAMAMQGMQPTQPQKTAEKQKATEPPALTAMQQRIEMDRYDEDKKAVGVEEAAKRAEEREKKRVEDWTSAQAKSGAEAAEAAKPVLAGRHNSVGAYTGSSPKCGIALASAFDIKMVRK